MKYKFIASLPMKGHSERIKNKNIKNLCGRPLFFYISDTLRSIKLIKKLIINTDSQKIAMLAKKRYGDWVEIHERPKYLMGDNVSMNKIINYDVKLCGENNFYIQTHSTNPLLKSNTLRKAISNFENLYTNDSDVSIFSVNKIRSRLYDKNLLPINHDPNILERTQDLDEIYEENSCFYIFNGNTFIKYKHRISKKANVFSLASNNKEYLDIDDLFDWKLAESIIKSQ